MMLHTETVCKAVKFEKTGDLKEKYANMMEERNNKASVILLAVVH